VKRVDRDRRRHRHLDATRPIDEVITALEAAGVPVGRIYTVADIAADPQYRARDMIVQTHDVDGRPLKVPGIVPKLMPTRRAGCARRRRGWASTPPACWARAGWPDRARGQRRRARGPAGLTLRRHVMQPGPAAWRRVPDGQKS
jgi:hypothetical protein